MHHTGKTVAVDLSVWIVEAHTTPGLSESLGEYAHLKVRARVHAVRISEAVALHIHAYNTLLHQLFAIATGIL